MRTLQALFAFALLAFCPSVPASEDVTLKIHANGRELVGATEIMASLPATSSTRQLESAVADSEAASVTIHDHESMQLTVMRTTGSGAPEDITESADTHYTSSAPWLATVSPTGLVTAEPAPGQENASASDKDDMRNFVTISIVYVDNQGRRGGNIIFLKVLP